MKGWPPGTPWVWPPASPWVWPPIKTGPSQRPPLPASAVEYWHSELQCTPSAWVGQRKGTSIPGVNTPTVAADPGYFSGRVVAQASIAGAKNWVHRSISPRLLAAGSKPWVYSVGRYRSVGDGASNQVLTNIGAGAGVGRNQLTIQRVSGQFEGTIGHSLYLVYDGAFDVLPHRFEQLYNDGTDKGVLRVDGITTTAAVGVAASTLDDTTAVGMGTVAGTSVPSLDSDASVAFYLICSTKPTDPEIAALDAWAQAYWGLP